MSRESGVRSTESGQYYIEESFGININKGGWMVSSCSAAIIENGRHKLYKGK